jgi:hypothetical protein
MADPFANLKSLTDVELVDISTVGGLVQPFDDVPEFDPDANPEVDTAARLSGDRRHVRTPTRRLFRDYRSNPDAFRHLDPLPAAGESLHGVISGKYALFDLVAAIIERTGQNLSHLYLCTLGFSKQNGADLCGFLDAGQVGRVTLVCSHYFEKTSANIYDVVVPELVKRGQRVLAMRSHTKMLLARTADGTCYVCESSANLRSCVNIEQFVLTNCPDLYAFHQTWIEELFTAPPMRKK